MVGSRPAKQYLHRKSVALMGIVGSNPTPGAHFIITSHNCKHYMIVNEVY